MINMQKTQIMKVSYRTCLSPSYLPACAPFPLPVARPITKIKTQHSLAGDVLGWLANEERLNTEGAVAMGICLGLAGSWGAESREYTITLNKRAFTEMGVICFDTGFKCVEDPRDCANTVRGMYGILEKVMATLSKEVPELPWQVIEERIKRHKEGVC